MRPHRVFLLATINVIALWSASAIPSVDAARTGVTCSLLKKPLSIAARQCLCSPCYMCEFSAGRGGCVMKQQPGADLTDGSNAQFVQGPLDATAWFLTEDEMRSSRGGIPRTQLALYSRGNDVQTFVAGDEYFKSVLKEFQDTKEDDRILLTGWSVDQFPLDPVNDPTGERTGLKALASAAVARGVDFRALVWANIAERSQNIRMRDFINNLPAPKVSGPGRFLFDSRLPGGGIASHHQKTVIIEKQEDLIAYVGGLDITGDRWDTVEHDQAQLRKATNITRDFDGWLDAHLRLHGPSARDIAANFLSRWNSAVNPSQTIAHEMIAFKNPKYQPLPLINMENKQTTNQGSSAVQVVRTFSCKYKKYTEFAPRGENSLLEARIKAIRNAQNYIYIEDQYFILVPELLRAVLEVMPRLKRMIVVVQRPVAESKNTGYEKYLFDMVAPIQKQFPNKFQLYTTRKERNLYIHSKVFIADDIYLSVGSSNWNRRSMTSDSEIAANVVDSEQVATPDGVTGTKVVRDFRLRKFAEKTGLSVQQLDQMSLIQAADELDAAAARASSIIEPLVVDERPIFALIRDEMRKIADPQDQCEL